MTRLTKDSVDSRYYANIIAGGATPISFQVRAEALSAMFTGARQRRLFALLRFAPILRHSNATDIRYARTARARRELKRLQQPGSDASDGDIWVIASALEHSLSLLSHDRQQIALAREVSLPTFTNLPTLRDANPAPT